MFRLVVALLIDSKVVEGGRCMRSSDRRLCFDKKIRGKFEYIMKPHGDMGRICHLAPAGYIIKPFHRNCEMVVLLWYLVSVYPNVYTQLPHFLFNMCHWN